MEFHLVVIRAFAGFSRGDIITDPGRIAEILNSEQARSVVRVAARAPGEAP